MRAFDWYQTTLVDPEMTLDGNYALCRITNMCFRANH